MKFTAVDGDGTTKKKRSAFELRINTRMASERV